MEENKVIQEKVTKVNGDTFIKEYTKGKLLGKGGFAKCYEFINKETNKIMASKIIPKATLVKSRSRQKLISEIKIHKSLHNPNIVQFEHVFEDTENVYILLELCHNQTLNELVKRRKRLTEIEVQCYVIQIIQTLKYLHSNRVIHRDLKLGNLFLSQNMEIKLGDFGLATRLEFDEEKKRTICGTPNYIAPEILDDKIGHSYPVDIWSLGVIIYTLLIGKPPFETADVKTTYKKIRANTYSFPDSVQISDQVKNLIESILKLDPSARPSLNDILSHPFLSSNPIPKNLPLSTLACVPSQAYSKQFQTNNLIKPMTTGSQLMGAQSQRNLGTGNFGKIGKNDQSQPIFHDLDKNKITTTQTMNNFNPITDRDKGTDQIRNEIQSSSKCHLDSTSEICVSQWVDYSSKYGLGYVLNNGCSGVFFNDSTKMIMEQGGRFFQYKERRSTDKIDISTTYSVEKYPEDLKKKVTLLQHFRNYLLGIDKKGIIETTEVNKQAFQEDLVYVKKWMKTSHSVMFRLSNKIVQVNFTDKTEIHLSSEQKMVVYINKKNERLVYPLATALESNNSEMAKRLRYTKEILTHIYNSQNKPKEEEVQNFQQEFD